MNKQQQDQIYEKAGFAGRLGFGERPALVIIDMNKGATDPSCPGSYNLDAVIDNLKALLAIARSKRIPIIYTTNEYEKGCWDAGIRLRKLRGLDKYEAGSPYVEIDPRLTPLSGERLIKKKYSSAFFGTHLTSALNAARVDTVILTGTSVSGCIRAAAMDSLNYGFHTLVVREAVGDRSPLAYEQNLYDINAKIADVVSLGETMEYLKGLPDSAAAEDAPTSTAWPVPSGSSPSGQDRQTVYQQAGMGARAGFGESPALLVVDMYKAASDPSVGGRPNLNEALPVIQKLLAACRERNIPIIFSTTRYENGLWDSGVRHLKGRVLAKFELHTGLSEIDERMNKQPGEHLVVKKQASAFFGTPLASSLIAQRIDTVIVVGEVTSGCVRATALDCFSMGFRTIVVREGVADRDQNAQIQSLSDMDQRFADVVSVEEALSYISRFQAAVRVG